MAIPMISPGTVILVAGLCSFTVCMIRAHKFFDEGEEMDLKTMMTMRFHLTSSFMLIGGGLALRASSVSQLFN